MKMIQMNIFARQDRDADVENGHVDNQAQESNWGIRFDINTLPSVRQIASGYLQHSIGAHLGAL